MTTFAQLASSSPASAPPTATDGLVGRTAGGTDVMFSGQQVGATPPNIQTGTTYTLALSDAGNPVGMNNASANIVTIPPNSSVAFIVGVRVTIYQKGTGTTTIAAGSGVTLEGSVVSTAGQYAGITIMQESANVWVAFQ
jgi:hypothetical protein